jgi:hypothetical protein
MSGFAKVPRFEQGAPAAPVGLRGVGPLGLSLICSPKTHTSRRAGAPAARPAGVLSPSVFGEGAMRSFG